MSLIQAINKQVGGFTNSAFRETSNIGVRTQDCVSAWSYNTLTILLGRDYPTTGHNFKEGHFNFFVMYIFWNDGCQTSQTAWRKKLGTVVPQGAIPKPTGGDFKAALFALTN